MKQRAFGRSSFFNIMFLFVMIVGFFYIDVALAAAPPAGQSLEQVTKNITGQFQALGRLILAVSFLAGIGFIMAAIFKFKQHKDNPTQIPLGTPVGMLVIGAVLVFLPNLIFPIGTGIFGATAAPGGFKGGGVSVVPGASS